MVLVGAVSISAFTTHHASLLNNNNHQYDILTTTIHLAVQDKILDGLRSKLDDGESRNNNNQSTSIKETSKRIPFIIQRIGRGNKKEIEEITKLCIEVFFNDQEGVIKANTPWKALQLAYLRNYQKGDILARNAFKKDQLVDLIVARRVYFMDGSVSANDNSDSIGSDCQIFNAEQLPTDEGESRLIVGEIIGYCEMTEKKFGLGGNFEVNEPKIAEERLRPYLGNLSVVKYARFSGVGSKLLDECEAVATGWNSGHTEIVLQVEEDNTSAIQFYKRRGWEFVFADPSCRRYDTTGFLLKETRVTKYAMIKRLDKRMKAGQNGYNNEKNATGESILDKLRSSFFVKK
jgi:ribosomal protein S18 acetylase RimI-like enzyme